MDWPSRKEIWQIILASDTPTHVMTGPPAWERAADAIEAHFAPLRAALEEAQSARDLALCDSIAAQEAEAQAIRERDAARAALREVLDILRIQAPDIYEALDDARALGDAPEGT